MPYPIAGIDVHKKMLAVAVVVRKNLRGDGFQLVVMMQAAETWPGNDAMSGS